MSKRAIFYDDGFNLYHAIDDLNKPHLKWLSLQQLAETIVPSKSETVEKVVFFSASPSHLAARRPDKLVRHRTYVKALKATGVECVLGRFKQSRMQCRNCRHTWQTAEEKETDVAIAVRLLEDAFLDRFDVVYLISGDTDLVPALKSFKNHFPEKKLVVVTAPHRYFSSELLKLADARRRLKPELLERCLLPREVALPNGGTILRPSEYDTPA